MSSESASESEADYHSAECDASGSGSTSASESGSGSGTESDSGSSRAGAGGSIRDAPPSDEDEDEDSDDGSVVKCPDGHIMDVVSANFMYGFAQCVLCPHVFNQSYEGAYRCGACNVLRCLDCDLSETALAGMTMGASDGAKESAADATARRARSRARLEELLRSRGADAAAETGGAESPAMPTPAPPRPTPRTSASSPASGADTAPTGTLALRSNMARPIELAAGEAERERQVDDLVAQDPEGALWLARELLRRIPTARLPEESMRHYASAPDVDPDVEADRRREPPTTLTVRSAPGAPLVVRRQVRCACCDTLIGDGDTATCPMVEMLQLLSDDMQARPRTAPPHASAPSLARALAIGPPSSTQPHGTHLVTTQARDDIIANEIQLGYDEAGLHRSARYVFYRQFIAMKYGHLGAGVRIRLPDCVVAAIRCRWPEPSCTCDHVAIARCTAHGYTGFRAQR